MKSTCVTKPTLIGRLMSYKNFLVLYFYRPGVSLDKAEQLAELNKNNVYFKALYTQAYHETAGFTSNIYRNSYNMFGMKAPNTRKKYCAIHEYDSGGYAAYQRFIDGIDDRIGWDNQKSDFSMPVNEQDVDDYFAFIVRHHYAEDVEYSAKLMRLYRTLTRHNMFDINKDMEGANVRDILAEVGQVPNDDLSDGTSYETYAKPSGLSKKRALKITGALIASYFLYRKLRKHF